MDHPNVTVLMTVYNGARYLKSSLQSVLNQTYKNFEFLIINDGSSDDSLKIIESFRDPRIQVHTNPANLGQTKSLNLGLRLASGRWIARMDADDLAFPRWLERQVNFISVNFHYAVVSSQAVVISSEGKIRKTLKTPSPMTDILLRCLTASPINHVGCLMQKSIILEVGGYDEDFRIAADYSLWSKLLRKGYQLTTLPELSVAIRFHDASQSNLEKGQRDAQEMSKIMLGNIEGLTTVKMDLAQVLSIWKTIYDCGPMSDEEFRQGQEFLKSLYPNLRSEWDIPLSCRQKFLQRQLLTVNMKRAFALIGRREILRLRELARQYMACHGPANAFLGIYLLSFLGVPSVQLLPGIYERILELSTRKKLIRVPYPAFVHGR